MSSALLEIPVDSSEFTQQAYQQWLTYEVSFAYRVFGIREPDAEDIFQKAMLSYLAKKDDPKYASKTSFVVFGGFFRKECLRFRYSSNLERRRRQRLAMGLEVRANNNRSLHPAEISTAITLSRCSTPSRTLDSTVAEQEINLAVLHDIRFSNVHYQTLYELLLAGRTRTDIVAAYPHMNRRLIDKQLYRIRKKVRRVLERQAKID
ncbi:MAG TPA: hypothetical protein VJB87_00785 [Candidatus Nanoarchaeia archaeon]|nr:hypothetical protein [Candidatus Nanoarchaeia archaeon]